MTTTDMPPQTGRKRRRAPCRLPHPAGRAAAIAASLLLTTSLPPWSSDGRPTPTAMHAEAASAGVRAASRAPPSLRKNGTRGNKKHRPGPPPAGSSTGERISVVVQPENLGRGPQHLIPDSGSAQSEAGAGDGGGGGARGWSHPTFDHDGYGSGWRGLLPFGTSQRKPIKNKNDSRGNHKPPRKGGVEATFDEWLQYQSEMNSNALGDASANNVLSYDEWLEAQSQAARRGSTGQQRQKRRNMGDSAVSYEEWLSAQSDNVQSSVMGYGSSRGTASGAVEEYNDWINTQRQMAQKKLGDSLPSFEEWMEAQSGQFQQSAGARGSSSGGQQSASQAEYESWLQAQSEAVSGALGDSIPSYDEWLEMVQQQQQQYNAMGSSSQSNLSQEDYESWLETQSQLVKSSGMGSSPAADVDTVAGKQVILRPRLADGSELSLPALGSSVTSRGGDQPTVYYYDPSALQATSGQREEAPELTLPTVVYDASGRALSMSSVHAGGRNQVFLEVRPRSAAWGDGIKSQMSNLSSKLNLSSSSSSLGTARTSAGGAGGGGSDQLIVLVTLATTAVVVGMLAARRLRSRRLLEDCLGLEDDDENDHRDAVGRDKKYDADTGLSVAGSSAAGGSGFVSTDGLMGGRGAGGYYGTATPGGGSGLHWRGDSEKFDV